MNFNFPWVFVLALFLPFIWMQPRGKRTALLYSSSNLLSGIPAALTNKYRDGIIRLARTSALLLMITALACPLASRKSGAGESFGADILLVVDVSSSMLAEDFSVKDLPISRLEAVKNVISEFIKTRKNDRVGIEMFAGEPMIVCPLTADHDTAFEFLQHVKTGVLPDKTAIGDAILYGINRIKKSPSKSRIIILLTDGDNNAGRIEPYTAAEIAKKLGIRVYTICAGKKGPVPYPVDDPFKGKQYRYIEIPVNEALLVKTAELTGASFFRAANTAELRQIYSDIDSMEKSRFKRPQKTEYREIFHYFLLGAVFMMLLELILANLIFAKVP